MQTLGSTVVHAISYVSVALPPFECGEDVPLGLGLTNCYFTPHALLNFCQLSYCLPTNLTIYLENAYSHMSHIAISYIL